MLTGFTRSLTCGDMQFRVCLAALRAAKGLRSVDLANACGFWRSEITRMEGDENKATSARAQDGLARGFGVHLDVIRQLVAGTMSVPEMADAFGVPCADLKREVAAAEERDAARAAREAA
jgi:transcriptional regulator with XRE-family HTH domain